MVGLTDAIVKNNLQITLWGPPLSGKTWMLEAFKKTVAMRNSNDPEFSYQLLNFNDDALLDYDLPPNEKGKLRDRTHRWKFVRFPKKHSVSHLISTQTHYLYVHDLAGKSLHASSDDTQNVVKNSNLIIVFLDSGYGGSQRESLPKQKKADKEPDLFDIFGDEPEDTNISSQEDISNSIDYHRSITTLFNYLEGINNRPLVAICLSKVDKLPNPIQDIQEFIKYKFGSEMLSVISAYDKRYIKYFQISSTGFLLDDLRTPNFNPDANSLLDKNQWNPKVESPFYWFFDRTKYAFLDNVQGLVNNLYRKYNRDHYIKAEREHHNGNTNIF